VANAVCLYVFITFNLSPRLSAESMPTFTFVKQCTTRMAITCYDPLGRPLMTPASLAFLLLEIFPLSRRLCSGQVICPEDCNPRLSENRISKTPGGAEVVLSDMNVSGTRSLHVMLIMCAPKEHKT
jgi:hypothetical protein